MPKISERHIAEAIYEATEGRSGKELDIVLKRAVKVLKDRRLLSKSKDILRALQDISDKKNGIVRMKVITRSAINGKEKKNIEHEIMLKYKAKKIASEFFENPEVLGGMRIEVGDEVNDTTYKSKLERLEKFLIQK